MSPSYRDVLGKVEGLQRGFTSGTCALAASQAAAEMLLKETILQEVKVSLQNGMELVIPVIHQDRTDRKASCGVIKDSGDDTDITHGKEFCAAVSWSEREGVEILGGKGIGTVTLPGLSVSVGEPAINPHPRKMITRTLEELLKKHACEERKRGLQVILSVPEGESLAKETWNPRIGIEGGISIIGTSGIIEPKSSKAFKASIVLLLKMAAQKDASLARIISGYVGEAYFSRFRGGHEGDLIKVGDHIGFALKSASQRFSEIILAGHIGKMAKLASGLFDTHSRYGDARLETIAAYAAAAGASREDVRELLDMKMAEAAVPFLKERGLRDTFDLLNRRLIERCIILIKKEIPFTSVILDLKGNPLSEICISREEASRILEG